MIERIRISSSISNFRSKLLKRTGLPEWGLKFLWSACVFFGMYHPGDYLSFLLHRGHRTCFWTGSDCTALKNGPRFWQWLIRSIEARHIVENEVEREVLARMGIRSEVHPMIFDPPEHLVPCYEPAERPHVYLNAHPGSEDAYGVNFVEGIAATVPACTFHIYGVDGNSHDNMVYHGLVPSGQFDAETAKMQCGLRYNTMDGMSEVLSKSILRAQWPISRIKYPYIDWAPDATSLVRLLRKLPKKRKPNLEARNFWAKKLQESLDEVLCRR